MATSPCGPIDFVFLQDLSGSYADDLPILKAQIPNLIAAIEGADPLADFGVASFIDKPTGSFGSATDYVYQTHLGISADNTAIIAAVNALGNNSGADGDEAQLEGLLQVALRDAELGYRAGSTRVVMLSTDSGYHVAGDFASQPANNLDTILDGTPPGTGEDYPTIDGVRAALVAADIFPVFSVTAAMRATYEGLVAQLGFGAVVTLTSDSVNFSDAVRQAIALACGKITHPGTDGNDTIDGTVDPDGCFGGLGDDSISGFDGDDTLDGGGDDDTCLGGTGNDEIYGGTGNDDLYGEDDDDILSGGIGDDSMTGGAGADVFKVNPGDGTDVIQDFEDGIDRLDLSGMDKLEAGTAVLGATAVAGGTKITFADGSSILLVGVDPTTIDLADAILDATNAAPVAMDDTAITRGIDPVNIDILANDTDLEGDTLSLVSVGTATHGAVAVEADGTVTYTADAGYVGPDSFLYVIGDGTATSSAHVSIDVKPVLTGGPGDDYLIGIGDPEFFQGFGGNDTIEAMGGNDTLDGGDGADELRGGAGDDEMTGGPGADIFVPGSGADTVTDFEDGVDRIDLSWMDKRAAALAVLGATESGGTTTIGLGAASIALTGFAKADLGLDDVILDAANAAPIAADDTATTLGLAPVTVDVLANDFDVEGDTLSVAAVSNPAHGTAAIEADGTVTYTADLGFIGTDIVTCTISDGALTTTSLLRVTVERDLIGSAGPDYLIGDGASEIFEGFAGDDTILAQGGDDSILAGDDADLVFGGVGMDTIDGGAGDDSIVGGPASVPELQFDADSIHGGAGRDTVEGGADGDTIFGDGGDDELHGGIGGDHIDGGAGDDVLDGGAEDDKLLGGAGDDTLDGGTGDDEMDGGDGNDTYLAGIGLDTIEEDADPATSVDTIQLRPGIAFADVSFAASGTTLTITVPGGSIRLPNQLEGDPAKEIEWIAFDDGGTYDLVAGVYSPPAGPAATEGDDTLIGTAGNDTIDALGGNDRILAGGGDDLIIGGPGDDALFGQAGADTYRFASGFGTDTVDDGINSPNDAIEFTDLLPADIRLATNATADLVLHHDASGDSVAIAGHLNGVSIERLLFADGSTLDLTGGLTLTGSRLSETIPGTDFDDTITTFNRADAITGNGGGDTIAAGSGPDVIYGDTADAGAPGGGDDKIRAQAGRDLVMAGSGKDLILGGAGDDSLFGGADDDRMVGGSGADVMAGDAGRDLLTGGSESDIFVFTADGNRDVIFDFEPGLDVLDLTALGLTEADLTYSQISGGRHLLIDAGVTEIVLRDHTLADIDPATDLLF